MASTEKKNQPNRKGVCPHQEEKLFSFMWLWHLMSN